MFLAECDVNIVDLRGVKIADRATLNLIVSDVLTKVINRFKNEGYNLYNMQLTACLRPCHTLPDSANGRVTDSKILCPFVSVRMRFLSVPHAVNAFRVR